MLAGELMQAGELALEVFELRRIDIKVRADAIKQDRRLVDLDRGGIEHRIDFGQARFVLLYAGQFAAQMLQLSRQGRGIIASEAGEGAIAGGDQTGRMGLAAMRDIEFGDCLGIEGLAIEFVELVRQPFAALGDITGLAVARLGQGIALAQQGVPVLRGSVHVAKQGIVATAGIEQRQLAGLGQQRLVLMLAVDLDQPLGQRSQLRQGGRPTVDPRP